MNCWLCKKPKTKTDNPDPHKVCRQCSAKLQGVVRLCPMEKSTPLTHEEWVERGNRTANSGLEPRGNRRAEPQGVVCTVSRDARGRGWVNVSAEWDGKRVMVSLPDESDGGTKGA